MIGVLGGTFDPVHFGHLRLALEMCEGLALKELRMIPAGQPPHRGVPAASARDRLAMLEAAVAGTDRLRVDPRELQREGPSYTVDTLASLRAELPDDSICLIVGMDAFNALTTWHCWQELLNLAHIGIARRPGAITPNGGKPAELLKSRQAQARSALDACGSGLIWIHDIPLLDISGARIRALLAAARDPRFLLPDAALRIIHQRGLYIAKH